MLFSVATVVLGLLTASTAVAEPIPQLAPRAIGRPSLWQPKANTPWQIILSKQLNKLPAGKMTPDVPVWDLDMFDTDAAIISGIQAKGKKVICYFSAGSSEDWRDDFHRFKVEDLGWEVGRDDAGGNVWEGEHWLKISNENVRSIMRDRIKLAAEKGCDAIDPDNVDGYANKNGLGLTAAETVEYMTFLRDEAAKYNMATGLKNAGSIVEQLVDVVHFSVNEQCVEYKECAKFAPFIAKGKPVFHIEYPSGIPNISSKNSATICGTTGAAQGRDGFSTVMKRMNLNGWVQYCDGTKVETPTS